MKIIFKSMLAVASVCVMAAASTPATAAPVSDSTVDAGMNVAGVASKKNTPSYSASAHVDGRDSYIRFDLSHAKGSVNENGEVEVRDDKGVLLEVMPVDVPQGENNRAMRIRYDVSPNGKTIKMYRADLPDVVVDGNSGSEWVTAHVDQQCAANNVYWGAATGALTGLAGVSRARLWGP